MTAAVVWPIFITKFEYVVGVSPFNVSADVRFRDFVVFKRFTIEVFNIFVSIFTRKLFVSYDS